MWGSMMSMHVYHAVLATEAHAIFGTNIDTLLLRLLKLVEGDSPSEWEDSPIIEI